MTSETIDWGLGKTLTLLVGAGDFFDRMTILEIKSERIVDTEKRKIALGQLGAYKVQHKEFFNNASIDTHASIAGLMASLKDINNQLWEIEDTLRAKESAQDFGDEFVSNARQVYILNDQRALLKQQIDEKSGSAVSEVKEHGSAAPS